VPPPLTTAGNQSAIRETYDAKATVTESGGARAFSPPETARTGVSVLILTFNEEANLSGCLDSVAWSDDVVVLDSFSTDATVSIARQRGARLFQRAFDNYAAQRNFGLKEVAYRNPWVLMLDADERVPPALCEEILRATGGAASSTTLFRMRRKDYLHGRWIKRSSGYPTWFGRLMRVGRAWVERPYNEEFHTDGEIVSLSCHLDHYPFNKGFAAWIQKHDSYSTMEAKLRASQPVEPARLRDLFARDPSRRRRSHKALLYRMPMRPVLVFAGLYLVKGGLLEGRAGLTFSLLRAWYEYLIDCKTLELRRRAAGLPI
jgi:glycosyltransferase involved in cell wall biosynthesis